MPPTVTVVVVNFNGKDYLEACLGSLRNQSLPADDVEIILIDNASTDGSVPYVRKAFPEVRIVVNDTNTVFSPAVNQGARLAGGTYLALLNNDAVADSDWLEQAVAVLEARPEVVCVASKIVRSEGDALDFAGSELSFYGHGFARKLEEPDDHDHARDLTLFASGGAMIVRTATFLDVGGFDESYLAFFEDVDFGWRLWVLGHQVAYVPASRVVHRHHGTISQFGYARERYLLERNALATVFKNYGDELLASALPPTVLLTVLRGLLGRGEVPLPDFTLKAGATPLDNQPVEIPALAAAHLAAIRDFGVDLPALRKKRTQVQSRRRRDDQAILPLFVATLQPNVDGPAYLEIFRNLVEAFDLEDKLRAKRKILLLTEEPIAQRMSAAGIRAWEMATMLSRWCDVTLASTQPITIRHDDFATAPNATGLVVPLYDDTEAVVVQAGVLRHFPALLEGDKPLLVDLAEPFHLAGMALHRVDEDWERHASAQADVAALNHQLERGDFFVCASGKQRDYWLGQLSGLKRINPATYDADDSLRRLVDVAPYGVAGGEPPPNPAAVVRGVVDGIADDDFLVVAVDDASPWCDPLTLVRAVADLTTDQPDLKLYFLVDSAAARELAESFGVLDKHVFFNPEPLPYHRRHEALLEADVAVSLQHEHLDAAFGQRIGVLDALWCRRPLLVSDGDASAAIVAERGLGLVVPAGDIDATVAALRRLREDQSLRQRCVTAINATLPAMVWDQALAPVAEFCRRPRRAPDAPGQPTRYTKPEPIKLPRSLKEYILQAREEARAGGANAVVAHARQLWQARQGA